MKATLLGMASSVAIGLSMTAISVYSMMLYGAALFFATPFLMGVTTAFAHNFRAKRLLVPTIGVALLSIVITGGVVLLFAIDGCSA